MMLLLQQQPSEALEFLFSSSLINLLQEELLGHRLIELITLMSHGEWF